MAFTALRVAQADAHGPVSLQLPTGLTANAVYRRGDRQPAVLLLHGFLQTSNYLTVNSLLNGLADQGYSVLAPTLSLGVDRRKASLDCEAIHSHSLEDDLAEIGIWLDWLEAHGHDRVVLVGHSQGSLELVAYAAQQRRASIAQLVATSLVTNEHSHGESAFARDVARARRQVSEGHTGLSRYKLAYCSRYVAPPKAFLSYADWPRQRILDAVTQVPVPVRVILGSVDPRAPAAWVDELAERGVAVKVIQGAGHFFDAQHEFDLLDAVVEALELAADRS